MAKQQPTINVADPIISPTAIEDGKLIEFDAAIACPPFGMKYSSAEIRSDYFGRFPDKGNSGNVIMTRHLLAHAKGSVVVLLPTAILFSTGAEASMREELVDRGIVKAVIMLPVVVHKIATCILVLDPQGGQKKIKFIDGSNTDVENIAIDIPKLIKAKKDNQNRTTVDTATVLANDADLQVSSYVLSDKRKKVKEILASAKTAKLAEVCQLIAPVAFPKSEDGVPVRTLDMSCFTDHGFVSEPVKTLDTAIKVAERNELYLQPNDIVLAAKATVGRAGIVPPAVPSPGEDGWFPPRFAITLRCASNSPIDPRVLYLQLRSEFGQQLLNEMTVGATIPMIRLSDLKNMQIVIPDAKEAKKVIRAFDQEVELQAEIKVLQQKQQAITEKLPVFKID
jgi:type I restriction enzyme M protein